MEDPRAPAREARLYWTADRNPFVLQAVATPASACSADLFDIRTLTMPTSVLQDAGSERVVIGSAKASLRLDIVEGTLRDGPVTLRYLVPGLSASLPKWNTAQRLLEAYAHARLSPAILLSTVAYKRELDCLATWDALQAGASLREIAEIVFGRATVSTEWSGRSDHLKSAVRRLVAIARKRATGGYRTMLFRAYRQSSRSREP